MLSLYFEYNFLFYAVLVKNTNLFQNRSKTGEDILTIRLKRRSRQLKPGDVKGILV
jgi:hypothetical protein